MSDVALSIVSALIAATLYHAPPEPPGMKVDEAQHPDVILTTPDESTFSTLRRAVLSEPVILAILRSNRCLATSELSDIWTVIYQLRHAKADVRRCIEKRRPGPADDLRHLLRQLQWHIELRHALTPTKSIRAIPYDILIEIFKFCLSDNDDIYDTDCTRWRMMQVCYTWRDTMLSVSSLWSTIYLRIPFRTPGEIERFNTHIRCSANRPLLMFLDYFVSDLSFARVTRDCVAERPAWDALQLLGGQWARIRGLHVRARGNSSHMRLNLVFSGLPMLEELTIISPYYLFRKKDFPEVDNLRRARFFPHLRDQPFGSVTHLHTLIDSNETLRVLKTSSTVQTLRLDYRRFDAFPVYESRIMQAVYEAVVDLTIDIHLLPFVHTPNVQRLRINGPSIPSRVTAFLGRCGQHLSYLAVTGELIQDAQSATIFAALRNVKVLEVLEEPRYMARVLTTVDGRLGHGRGTGLERLILRNSSRTNMSTEYAAWKRSEVQAARASALRLSNVRIELHFNRTFPDDNWNLVANGRRDWTWSDLASTAW